LTRLPSHTVTSYILCTSEQVLQHIVIPYSAAQTAASLISLVRELARQVVEAKFSTI